MRRRITFIQRPDADFSLDQISLSRSSLSVHGVDAAREDRVTFSFDELPPELWHVLKQCHQLHIRWAAEEPYEARAPFSSRVSPGLHVFYTPVAGAGSGSGYVLKSFGSPRGVGTCVLTDEDETGKRCVHR
jgi:hypothetical protein